MIKAIHMGLSCFQRSRPAVRRATEKTMETKSKQANPAGRSAPSCSLLFIPCPHNAGFPSRMPDNKNCPLKCALSKRGCSSTRTSDTRTLHSSDLGCNPSLELGKGAQKTASSSSADWLRKAKRILWTLHTGAQLSLLLLTLLVACEIYPPTTGPRPIQGLLLWLILWLPLCSALWFGTIFADTILSLDCEISSTNVSVCHRLRGRTIDGMVGV